MPENNAYIGLARRYRPQLFSDLVGQEKIAHSLSQQIMQDKVAQGYIFAGPRGIGKTSAARILAKSLNCVEGPTPKPCGKCEHCVGITAGHSMDVIEIDGASNRKISDIRDLQERIAQATFAARRKVYIIDEVHMLTTEAFNALLKTLEEPPEFVIFVLATTDPEKIPETIKSRCQFFQFGRISIADLVRRLDFVAEAEGISIDANEREAIFETIALAVDGGMRDAMMTLDQLASLADGAIHLDETLRFLGLVEHDMLIRTVELLRRRESRALLDMVNELVDRGRDLERYVRNLLGFLRDLMILKAGGDPALVKLGGEKLERARALLVERDEQGRETELLPYATLLNYLQVFMNLEREIRQSAQVRVHLEFAFVKLTAVEPVVDIAQLLQRVENLPAGAPPPPPAPPSGGNQAPPPAPPREKPAPEPVETKVEAPPRKPPEAPRPDTPDLFGKARAAEPEKPMPEAETLWQQVLARADELGTGLSLALRDCRGARLEGKALHLEVPANRRLSIGCLQNAGRVEKLNALLAELAGQPLRAVVEQVEAVPAKAPVLNERDPDDEPPLPDAPPEGYADSEPPADLEQDTVSLYLAQNPVEKSRRAAREDGPFREKVELVRNFFEGKVYDAMGREIAF